MVDVMVSPFIKSIWLTATPVNAQIRNMPQSFLSMPAEVFPNSHTSQKSSTLNPTLKRFKANGWISEGEIIFTRLKLAAKKMLVPRTAICAFVCGLKSGQR